MASALTKKVVQSLPLVPRRAFPADTVACARWLIGKVLIRRLNGTLLAGRIVETEAYVENDAASHSFRGPTARNRAMYLRPGHAYVYFIYGTSFMLNISTGKVGTGEAVLIRALEPLAGLKTMRRLRASEDIRDLMRGPGRLARAMAIDLTLNGADLCVRGALWLADDASPRHEVSCGPRVGITRNQDAPWRFWSCTSPFVSGARSKAFGSKAVLQ